jgi:hypothetical protein
VFTPHELIERLVAIVPRPRAHLVHYSGVLAPASTARAQIVPSADAASSEAKPAPPPAGAEMPKATGPHTRGPSPLADISRRRAPVPAVPRPHEDHRGGDRAGGSPADPGKPGSGRRSPGLPGRSAAATDRVAVRARGARVRARSTGPRRLRRLKWWFVVEAVAPVAGANGPVCPRLLAVLVFPARGGVRREVLQIRDTLIKQFELQCF